MRKHIQLSCNAKPASTTDKVHEYSAQVLSIGMLYLLFKDAIKGDGKHLNQVVKNTIQGLGANKTNDGLVRSGKALGTINNSLMQYGMDNNVAACSGA